ncbi:MAG TPA: hypothetical protein DCP31_26000 [Cyanobacteria bacterium UBA8543]|nr:hypothetical protein [Cyanobacteria bacterium UBA8543]
MEKLSKYRAIARQVIDDYARYKPSCGNIDLSPVYDNLRSPEINRDRIFFSCVAKSLVVGIVALAIAQSKSDCI